MTLEDRITALNMHLYQGTIDEDIMIARWWDLLKSDGEINKLISNNAHALSSFFTLFRSPNMLTYTVADEEIETAHWAEPISTSPYAIFFSTWVHDKTRGTKRHALITLTAYEILFKMNKRTIIGITKQPNLIPLHEKLGYDIMSPIPDLFDAQDGWIVYLTEQKFKASRFYATATKILNKEYE